MRIRMGPYPLRLGDLNGAFGDLGVLIPLEAALIAINGLNPTTTLLGVGVIYILAGLYFRIPMPVQPLKALAALAVAYHSSPAVIAAAALLMAGVLTLLSVTRAIRLIERVVPVPVVRGVQIGLGLLLLKTAYQMVFQKPFLLNGQQAYLDLGSQVVPAGLLLGLGSVAFLLLLLRVRSVPAALVVVALGIALGFSMGSTRAWTIGPALPSLKLPSASDFWPALVLLVVPQVPLTLANSVIATADAARAYFGEQARRATPTRIALSVAIGNLWAGLAGGLPNCHGAGGLTAHYRLGARTPLATALLGFLLIGVALLFGRSAMEVRALLPAATLGALLFYVGIQHILLGLNVKSAVEMGLAVVVALVATVPGGNLAIGALAGLLLHWAALGFARARVLHWRPPAVIPERYVIQRLAALMERVIPSG